MAWKLERPGPLGGEIWGGIAAMMVGLPSAIALGVSIYAPLGGAWAAQGALAGILGATVLGLVAPLFGGTSRLITAPCAPAAAVLSAFTIEAMRQGQPPAAVLSAMMVVAVLGGLFQLAFGAIGLGKLIKYMPYPVVSGYLSGVGLFIILSQTPRFLGVSNGAGAFRALADPSSWNWNAVAVGAATMAAMLFAPRLSKRVPAPVMAIAAGVAVYFALALRDSSLLSLTGNPLVVGALNVDGGGFFQAATGRWADLRRLDWVYIQTLVFPALTLAVLLSIDTLKTCVVLDALTLSRHNSNRELAGQGLGNFASAIAGGIAGAGTMGPTLVNIAGGGKTWFSGFMEGVSALVAFLLLAGVLAWVPIAALAGILIVVGARMFDRQSLHLIRSRATILDFGVIVSVVVVAETVSLIAASGVGVVLAVLLFVREQIGGTVVRRKNDGRHVFSKQARNPREMEVLQQAGERTAIFELQGSLFFGTTNQLALELDADLKTCDYLVLDFRRVQSMDVTAAHMLEQAGRSVAARGAFLIFTHLPRKVPTGQDMKRFLGDAGVAAGTPAMRIMGSLDEALEWIEDRILEQAAVQRPAEKLLELREMEIFAGRKEETVAALEACMEERSYQPGDVLFQQGETGDEMFLIRRGYVRITMPLKGKRSHHLATFGRGDFVGEMSFLDRAPRSAAAHAATATDVFVLSRARFDHVADEHKRLGMGLLEGLAQTLANRLRQTSTELRVLQDS